MYAPSTYVPPRSRFINQEGPAPPPLAGPPIPQPDSFLQMEGHLDRRCALGISER